MEMALKPQLSAPGGTILSTWPTADGWGYAVISGTSMATPHVAGCYALIKQKFPNLTPQEIASRLQDTSTPLTQYGDPGFLTTVLQQGSGLINVFKALTYDTALSPTEFNLLDSSQLREESFTIENLSGSSKTYHLANMPAAAVDALPFLDQKPVDWTWSLVNNPAYACASFPSRTVTVGPNSKETVKVTIKPPTGLNPSKLPTYGGYILVTDGEKQYVIPYQGVPYSRSEQQTLDTSNLSNITTKPLPPAGIPNVPLVRAIDINRRDNDLMTFTFPAWAPPPDSDEDQDDDNNPLFFFVLRQPSPYLRLDAVSVDLADTFTPSSLGYDPTVKFTTNKPALPFDETFAGVPSYGMVFSLVGGFDKPPSRFQEIYGGYGQYGFQWSWAEVALSNGTLLQLPNADYRVLIRALKWGYDVEDANGYESWLSPILRVNISDPGYPNPYN
ncbi:hypothetical protein GQ53DRAFT_719504 [Thozetella sp. PMI_491]|nr:hypothetical protein GQ53DRAFT_719504 [Thozetella sp. PMI_491]